MNKKRILPALFTTTLLSLGLVVVSTPAKTEVVKAASEYVKANSIAVGDEVLLVYESNNMELSGISTTKTKYGIGTEYTDLPTAVCPAV